MNSRTIELSGHVIDSLTFTKKLWILSWIKVEILIFLGI